MSVDFTHLRGYLLNSSFGTCNAYKEGVPCRNSGLPGGGHDHQTLASPVTRPAMHRRVCVILLRGVIAVAAEAGPRRARLSRDLVDRLAQADAAATDVIVSGTERAGAGRWRRATARRVKKRAARRRGARGHRRAARRAQPGRRRRHLSGDAPVHADVAVTTEAIGADQVWAGRRAASRGFTGRGIGVAVIDSGVARAPALQRPGRRVSSTSPSATRRGRDDQYGHGTHVAGHHRRRRRTAIRAWRRARSSSTCRRWAPTARAQTSDVIAAIDWAIDNRARVQHPHHQPVARAPGVRVVPRRSAVPGRAAGGRRRHPGGGGGGQLRQDGGRPADRRRHRRRRATRRRR